MTSPEEDVKDTLLVAIHEGIALVRVRGRGSFKTGPALKQFGLSAIGGGCGSVILDMDECLGMDSTFMGVLAGMAMRLKTEASGSVVMMNLSTKTAELLKTLGLDRMIETYQAGEMPDKLKEHLAAIADVSELDISAQDRHLTLETMLAAHQDLVKVSPDNLTKFKDVIDYAGQDLKFDLTPFNLEPFEED